MSAGGRVAILVPEQNAELGTAIVGRHEEAAVHVGVPAGLVTQQPAHAVDFLAARRRTRAGRGPCHPGSRAPRDRRSETARRRCGNRSRRSRFAESLVRGGAVGRVGPVTAARHADAIVVGLGAMGSATAHQLALRGASVLAFDQYGPPHEFGSTHGDTRITRLAIGEGLDYVPLVRRSHEIWRGLERESGAHLLTQCGGLILGRPRRPVPRPDPRCGARVRDRAREPVPRGDRRPVSDVRASITRCRATTSPRPAT